MSKLVGTLLLGGLLLFVLVSLGLITWVWIRASNDASNNATPTKSSQLFYQEERVVSLVDARQASAATPVVSSPVFSAYYTLASGPAVAGEGFAVAVSGSGLACA